jgi:hypothetical protein
VTDPLAYGRELILFDNADAGRSAGDVPETIAGMAEHSMAFLDGPGIYPESFTRHATAFLSSDSELAVF